MIIVKLDREAAPIAQDQRFLNLRIEFRENLWPLYAEDPEVPPSNQRRLDARKRIKKPHYASGNRIAKQIADRGL